MRAMEYLYMGYGKDIENEVAEPCWPML